MRFKRADLPGFLLAVLAPPALTILFLASFDVWQHRGTPLLGFMATNIAIGIGLMAMFTRFVRNWDWPMAALLVIAVAVIGVIWAQQSGAGNSTGANILKWIGVLGFLMFNLVMGLQVLKHGLLPVLDRRDARRAQQQ